MVSAPLTEAAIERLRAMIVAGELTPGMRLPPEAELAMDLGASRNTVREAVRALVTARVLDVRRGDGTYVTSLRPELLLEGIGAAVELMQEGFSLELIAVRRILEPAATALAAIAHRRQATLRRARGAASSDMATRARPGRADPPRRGLSCAGRRHLGEHDASPRCSPPCRAGPSELGHGAARSRRGGANGPLRSTARSSMRSMLAIRFGPKPPRSSTLRRPSRGFGMRSATRPRVERTERSVATGAVDGDRRRAPPPVGPVNGLVRLAHAC